MAKKISGGVTFDVAEIEAFATACDIEASTPITVGAKKPKNGMPKVTPKARKDVARTHAAFCRALQEVGLYEEFIEPLSAMMERFRSL